MVRVVRSRDCGNSPKNRLVEDVAVALAIGDVDAIAAAVTEDVQWLTVGDGAIAGVADVAVAALNAKPERLAEVTIVHVMSHGKLGAANGIVHSGTGRYEFCHVMEFGNARGTAVQKITTYRVDL